MSTKFTRLALLLLGLCLALPDTASAFDHPGGVHSRAQIAAAQAALRAGDQPATAAWAHLIERADHALTEVPSAVVNFDAPGFYVDPDAHNAMKYAMLDDAEAAYSAALAYAIHHNLSDTRRNAYADAALALMNDWAYTNTDITLSSEASGNSSTLTMCVTGTQMALAAELLWDYPGWSAQDRAQFLVWATNILRVAGNDRQTRNSNHADWGIFAGLVVDHLLGDTASMEAHVTRLKEIIDRQIASDGSLPKEMSRGDRSLWYHYWALAPMTSAIDLVQNVRGEDLYDWVPPTGGTVRQAIGFFHFGVNNVDAWPGGPQVKLPIANGWGANLLSAMAAVFEDPSLASFAKYPIKTSGGGSAWIRPDLLPPSRKTAGLLPGETLVSLGATWHYLDDGSDPGTAWREAAFTDDGWSAGTAEFGYGDGDESTLVASGPADDHFITTYFRHHFQAANPGAASELILRIRRDDGAVVYLNGVELARSNMPAGAIGYQTPASTALGTAAEGGLHTFSVDPGALVGGDNVLAVEIHQASATSSDISFDLELRSPASLAAPVLLD
jgi:hypothetical protein